MTPTGAAAAGSSRPSRVRVCRATDVPEGSRRIVDVQGISIGVFHIKGRFYALRNRCPHLGAPLCRGRLTGLVTADDPVTITREREGEILRCPWHGWEFDVTDGRSVFNPHRIRARSYPVTVEETRAAEITHVESFPTSVSEDWVVVTIRRDREARTGGAEVTSTEAASAS